MFAERLKALRKEAGLTQVEIAKKLNISQPTYGQWETGKRNPSAETLEKFAKFFGTSTDYLLGKTDIKNSHELPAQDLEYMLDNHVLSYEGEPLDPHDREILKQVIKDYFDGKLEVADWPTD